MNEERRNGAHRVFDDTFKQNAVQITLKGDRSIRQVAEQLSIKDSLLYTWRRQFAPSPGGASAAKGGLTAEQKDEEILRLRAEIMHMREREIVLRKSLGILSETPESGMPRLRR